MYVFPHPNSGAGERYSTNSLLVHAKDKTGFHLPTCLSVERGNRKRELPKREGGDAAVLLRFFLLKVKARLHLQKQPNKSHRRQNPHWSSAVGAYGRLQQGSPTNKQSLSFTLGWQQGFNPVIWPGAESVESWHSVHIAHRRA